MAFSGLRRQSSPDPPEAGCSPTHLVQAAPGLQLVSFVSEVVTPARGQGAHAGVGWPWAAPKLCSSFLSRLWDLVALGPPLWTLLEDMAQSFSEHWARLEVCRLRKVPGSVGQPSGLN